MSGVSCAHHIFGVEHLLGKFWNSESSVLLGSSAGKRSETDHEEMQSREGDQVHGEFSQVGVELAWESQAASDSGHGG